MKRADGRRVCDGSPESMHGAAGAPPQLTDGACVAAQSTDVAALRHTLQARPLALRLHRERAIGAKSTDLCAVDFHVGRAQRADNRGSRMLSRTRAHRASGGPGGGRPSSPPERPWPGSGIKGGCFSVRPMGFSINQMDRPPDALEQVEGWHTLMEAGSFHSGGGSNPHEPKVMGWGLETEAHPVRK